MLGVTRGDALDQQPLDRYVSLCHPALVGFAMSDHISKQAQRDRSALMHPGAQLRNINLAHRTPHSHMRTITPPMASYLPLRRGLWRLDTLFGWACGSEPKPRPHTPTRFKPTVKQAPLFCNLVESRKVRCAGCRGYLPGSAAAAVSLADR